MSLEQPLILEKMESLRDPESGDSFIEESTLIRNAVLALIEDGVLDENGDLVEI